MTRSANRRHRRSELRRSDLLGRNRKLKQGSTWLACRGPKPSPMSLNDRAADRQAQTHALRLGRVEGFKEAWEALRRQPRPGIPHPDAHAFRLVGFRADTQFAPAVTVAAHRLDGVDDQVDHHLLNLHPVAPTERQGLGELRLDRGADLDDLTPSENDRVADRFIYVEPIHLRRRFFDVIFDPVDDVCGPTGFGHNTIERFPSFAQIRRLHLQKILSRTSVIARRRDRLDDLMGDRLTQLFHGCDTIGTCQLDLQLAQLPLAAGDLQGNGRLRGEISDQFDLVLRKGLYALSPKTKNSD